VIRNEARTPADWEKADVWSLGCVLIEMVTGKPPFKDSFDNVQQALMGIATPSTTFPSFPEGMTVLGRDFLGSAVVRDAGSRLTPQQLLHHPFVARPHSVPTPKKGGGGGGSVASSNASSPLGSSKIGGGSGGSPLGTPPLHVRKSARGEASPGGPVSA
jgi:serine/threonine protein kinase